MKGLVEWANSEVQLPITTPVPGPLTLTAPQRGILEAYDSPGTRQLTLMMSSQIGKSMLMLLIMGWHMSEYPAQIMLTQATRDSMRRFMVEKVWPLTASNPTLREKIDPKVVNTMAPTVIDYTDGMVFTAWSGSPAMMRSATAEVVIADEVDVYKPTADYANPVDMLRQRGTTFGNTFKLVVASTPIDVEESTIGAEWEQGAMWKWHVPCYHCLISHELVQENIRNPRLYCPSCGAAIEEGQRLEIIEEGAWVADGDPESENQSFHLSQLYSQFISLEQTSKKLKTDRSNLRAYTTQILALPYETKVKKESAADHVDLLFTPGITDEPPTVITMSVDVQGNRLECQTVHWWGLLPRVHEHRLIDQGEWNQWWAGLADMIRGVKPDMVFVDRGYKTTDVRVAVEQFLGPEVQRDLVRLIRGSSSPDYPTTGDLVKTKTRGKARPLDLELDTNTGKEMLHDMIVGHGISFNRPLVPKDFATQITAEELKLVMRGQREVPRWVKRHPRMRNEALDCGVYNICARYHLGVEYRRVVGGETKEKLLDLMA